MTRKPWTKAWNVPIAMMTNTIASMTSTVPLVIATSHSCMFGTSEHLQTRRLDPRGPALLGLCADRQTQGRGAAPIRGLQHTRPDDCICATAAWAHRGM